jgi:hypothetical protein
LLLSFKDTFLQAQEKNTVKAFWPIVYSKFFATYPTRQTELDELDAEQREDETKANQDAEKYMEEHRGRRKAKAKPTTNKGANWPSYADTESWKVAREKVSRLNDHQEALLLTRTCSKSAPGFTMPAPQHGVKSPRYKWLLLQRRLKFAHHLHTSYIPAHTMTKG